MDKEKILLLAREYFNEDDLKLLERAADFIVDAHKDQKRLSGEPYTSHCYHVAEILLDLQLDPVTVIAGLLHDVLEDTQIKSKELEKEFGKEVTALVLGVTKLKDVTCVSHLESQIEYCRCLILAMADDLRVLLLKLADRLHNMRTLSFLPQEKRVLIAQETLEIYAPLAHRVGLGKIKWELEDLGFKYTKPEVYNDLKNKIMKSRKEREIKLQRIKQQIINLIQQYDIPITVLARSKHFYSIYGKMLKQNKPFEEIQDKEAVRIITDTNDNCYLILSILHDALKPVPDSFTDYIAVPRANMYQSLHTTVFFEEDNQMVEIQIRTEEMHKVAEYGIAAHWKYKSKNGQVIKFEGGKWIQNVADWQKGVSSQDFYEGLRHDLTSDEVYALTPRGEIKHLPRGSTCIDFAYDIHSDIGDHCYVVKVNNKVVPLSHVIKDGDKIEVQVSKKAHPTEEWLMYAKTGNARSRIRHYLKIHNK
ncbi:MAG: RelA/SpoT family protein [Elusimicrobiota bacterium]